MIAVLTVLGNNVRNLSKYICVILSTYRFPNRQFSFYIIRVVHHIHTTLAFDENAWCSGLRRGHPFNEDLMVTKKPHLVSFTHFHMLR